MAPNNMTINSDRTVVDVLGSRTGASRNRIDFDVKKNDETDTRRSDDDNDDDDDDDDTDTDRRHNDTGGNQQRCEDDGSHDHVPLNLYRDMSGDDVEGEGFIRSTTPPMRRGRQYQRQELEEDHHPDHDRRRQWKRLSVLFVLLSTIGFVVIDSAAGGNGIIKQSLISFLDWVEHHPIRGVILVSFVYAIATVLFVPGSILTLGAGYALGHAIPGPRGVAVAAFAVFVGDQFDFGSVLCLVAVLGPIERLSIFSLIGDCSRAKAFSHTLFPSAARKDLDVIFRHFHRHYAQHFRPQRDHDDSFACQDTGHESTSRRQRSHPRFFSLYIPQLRCR